MFLLVAVVLAGSPSERPAIIELMRQQPDEQCGTGNPWLQFVHAPHKDATNTELMAMAVDPSLSTDQRGYAFEALASQAQPAVLEFLRTHLTDAAAGSRRRLLIAIGLIEHGTTADVDRVVALLPGDVDLTHAAVITFFNERTTVSAPSLAAVSALVRASTDPLVREFGLGFLARREPYKNVLKQAIAWNEPMPLRAVLTELPRDADQDLVIDALAKADRDGRERAETWLVLHVAAALRSKGGEAIADALEKEWLSRKRRPGLGRAPQLAYLLATRLQDQGQLARAEQLYRAALTAVTALLAEPAGPYDADRDEVNGGTGVGVRAQLALLLLQTGRRAEATVLAAEVAKSPEDFREAEILVQNHTLGRSLRLLSIRGFEQEFAERAKGKP